MYDLFATCPQGLEDLLAQELRGFAVDAVQPTRGGVRLRSDQAGIYRLVLQSQLCHRLLLRLARFDADTPEDVYAAVSALDWSEHLAVDGRFMVEAKLRDTRLGNPHFMALKVKDAVVDQFRAASGQRPSVDTGSPDLRINLFVHRRQAELSLDLSGGGLRRPVGIEGAHWRGGLGAALLRFADWSAQRGPLVVLGAGDPDLLRDAALISSEMAPGLLLQTVGFEHWQGHKPALWNRLRAEAEAARAVPAAPLVHVWDDDRRRLQEARQACQSLGLGALLDWHAGSFERQPVPDDAGCVVLLPNEAPGPKRAAAMRHLEALLRRRFGGWLVASLALGDERDREATWHFKPDRTLGVRRGQRQFVLSRWRMLEKVGSRPVAEPEAPAAAPLLELSEHGQMLVNRLRKNLRHLGRWAERREISCYRLYDADLPEYAAAIDLYYSDQLWAVVQEYAPPAKLDPTVAARRLDDIRTAVAQVLELPVGRIVLKQRKRQKGTAQYEKLAGERQFHEVRETGLKLLVNFTDYLDTGLFLDHRPVRARLGAMAKGRQVLNLFAYTGAATVHMVAGGARGSTTVDLSKTYLQWAQRNLQLNGLAGAAHRYIQADCLEWLRAQAEDPASKRYGLIFMDPPTFSSSKRMEGVLDVQRDHVQLIRAAVSLLRPGGDLVFSNNFRRFRLDAEALADLHIEDISAATIDEDFRRNPRIHQCFLIRAAASGHA